MAAASNQPTNFRASTLNIPDQQKEEGDVKFDYGIYDHDDLEEEDEASTSQNAIVRLILSIPKNEKEDWRHTSIFQMLLHSGNQAQKLIFDGGSNTNVVSASMVE